jgi:dynein heavy chain
MGKAGGGRNELDPRFVSTFSVFNVTSPSDDAVRHIYRSVLGGHTEGFVEEIRAVVPVIVEITLGLYKVRRSILSVLLLFPYIRLRCQQSDDDE